jgi:hypothetical protein
MKDCKIRVRNVEESAQVERWLNKKKIKHSYYPSDDNLPFWIFLRGTMYSWCGDKCSKCEWHRSCSAEKLKTITVAELLKGAKMKEQKPYAIVTWQESQDPFKICYSEEEVKELCGELLSDQNVVKDSIRIYYITSIKSVSMSLKFRAVKS